MGSVNKVILVGNLGRDAELRYTPGGAAVATLNLATTEVWNDRNNQRQEKTEWHRVILWNNKGATLADLAERYMKKGDKVYIEGSIEYRSWQDREGQTRYTTEITGREVILLSGKGDGAESYTPANKVAAAASASASAPKGKDQSFEDFPEALDSEDDDLPF